MIYLRKAVESDMSLLYEWANESEVRRNSFHSDPIPFEAHRKWFESMMGNDRVFQYIMMEDDVPVGQIRLNVEGSEAEIGYSIAAPFRGKGYGRMLLRLIAAEASRELPEVTLLVAKVKPDNQASRRLFESEGYGLAYECYTLPTREGQGD